MKRERKHAIHLLVIVDIFLLLPPCFIVQTTEFSSDIFPFSDVFHYHAFFLLVSRHNAGERRRKERGIFNAAMSFEEHTVHAQLGNRRE